MRPENTLLLDVVRRRARPLTLGGCASMAHQGCEALVPLAIGLAVDHAVDGGSPATLGLAVAGVLGLFVALALGGGVQFWILAAALQREAHTLRVRAAGRILGRPATGYERPAGELMSVLTADVAAVAGVLPAVSLILSGVTGLAVTVVVLVRVDLALGLGLALVVPLLMAGIDRITPWLERRLARQQHRAGLAAAFAAELVAALRPVRALGGIGEAARRYRLVSGRSRQAALDAATASAVVTGAGLVATAAVVVTTTVLAGRMASSGRITVGELITVVAMASFVADPVQRVASGVQKITVSRASAARILPYLSDQEPLSVDDGSLPVGWDFGLAQGEMLGVVATDADAAQRMVDDVLAARYPSQDPAVQHVLAEPPAAYLLGGSVEAALDTGRATPPERTQRALVAAAADGLGAGPLTGGGANLSGGQRQRLALARALAADPPVLVLRDPLTAVDAVTEDTIARRLREARGRARHGTVVVTSSPALLMRCDRVVFATADGDRLVGDHATLLERPGYREAVRR
ncbi:ABC transporter ATP-binding protein [Kineosporia sp. J2-2]|uniref:ABC transporter ATP-binding protein n=1 Tax=Kineosporia corallincola TaxID=2835133 RepID=A0ABS5TT55_9ACTN|nr:ABC transporter ATP-binding protein [Kineosporia corallincola]MBT0773992.1 ABC transporter ATP-binding protein [Kineosporia corallincola]